MFLKPCATKGTCLAILVVILLKMEGEAEFLSPLVLRNLSWKKLNLFHCHRISEETLKLVCAL